MILIPVHGVFIRQHDDVTLALPLPRAVHHDGQDQLLQVAVELLVSPVIGELV